MIHKKLIIFICCCIWGTVWGQLEIPQIIPPTPTAAALGKYGDLPISLYTGSPTISIPIYEIKCRDMSIPISLSYHSSGIKVEEMASWVGLGWSLQAGGVITRTVKGLPDEDNNGFRGSNNMGQKVADYLANTMTPTEKDTYLRYVADGIWDSQPDVFHFNFMGHSGRMVYDADGSLAIIPFQNLKVEGHGANNIGFTITTPDGIKYIFQEEEITNSASGCGNSPAPTIEAVTSWYLSQIVTPSGEEIDFTYVSENYSYDMGLVETKRNLLPVSNSGCPTTTSISCTGIFESQAKRLSRIQSNMTRVDFAVPSTYRQDLLLSYQLDKINISYGPDFSSPSKVFKFDYSYFTSANDRLKLDQVTEYSGDESEHKPAHQFEYYTNIPGGIPPRISFKQDHWGFFNDNPENTLIPGMTYYSLGSLPWVLSGADRAPDPDRMIACALNKITYPTGGYTTFEFEPHDFGYIEGPNIEVSDLVIVNSHEESVVSSGPNNTVSNTFTIDFHQAVSIEITNPDLNSGEIHTYVEITDATGYQFLFIEPWSLNQTTWTTTLNLDPGVYDLIAFSNDVNTGCGIEVDFQSYAKDNNGNPIILSTQIAGGLRIAEMTHHDGISTDNDITTRYEYTMDSDPDRSSGVLVSRYIYAHGMTSIVNQSNPSQCEYLVRTSTSQTILGVTQGSHIGYRQVAVYQGDGISLGNGRTFNSFVSPYEIPDESPFNTPNLGGSLEFPFPPAVSFDHRRGKPMSVVEYAEGVSSEKTSETLYSYFLEPSENKKVVGALKVGYTRDHYSDQMGADAFGVGYYEYVSEWEYPTETISRVYDMDDPTSFIENITNSVYENPEHIQMTKSITTNSDGNIYQTRYRYPQDYASNTQIGAGSNLTISDLEDTYMLNLPIETQVWVAHGGGFEMIDGNVTTYKNFGTNANPIIKPFKGYRFESENPVAFAEAVDSDGKLVQINDVQTFYDENLELNFDPSNGKLIEHQSNGGPLTAYIWAYEGDRLTAQVTNAAEEDVAYTSFDVEEEMSTGGWIISGSVPALGWSTLNPKTGVRKFNLSNTNAISANITTSGSYILSFWVDESQGGSVQVPASSTLKHTSDPDAFGFIYYEYELDLPANGIVSLVSNGSVTPIDELRLYPANARMNTYSYDDDLRLTTMTDENNLSQYFEYDKFHRLHKALDFNRDIQGVNTYHYKQ